MFRRRTIRGTLLLSRARKLMTLRKRGRCVSGTARSPVGATRMQLGGGPTAGVERTSGGKASPVDHPRRHIPLALPVSGIAVENEPPGLAVRLFNSPARLAMRLATERSTVRQLVASSFDKPPHLRHQKDKSLLIEVAFLRFALDELRCCKLSCCLRVPSSARVRRMQPRPPHSQHRCITQDSMHHALDRANSIGKRRQDTNSIIGYHTKRFRRDFRSLGQLGSPQRSALATTIIHSLRCLARRISF